jgi:hypothetical protein
VRLIRGWWVFWQAGRGPVFLRRGSCGRRFGPCPFGRASGAPLQWHCFGLLFWDHPEDDGR